MWLGTRLLVEGFNATVCDCTTAQKRGFVRFSLDDCNHQLAPTPPLEVEYEAYTTIPTLKRFVGHTCSTWVITLSIYKDFWQWEKVTRTRLPVETSTADCRKMRDLRQCHGKSMDVLGLNKWALDGPPHIQSSWLQTTTASIVNCHLEEITLETECSNCTISSPLGDIPGNANGTFSHNLVTIVWDNKEKHGRSCDLHTVESGTALLFNTTDSRMMQLRDTKKQLDFLLNTTDTLFCPDKIPRGIRLKPVIGMDNVAVRYSLTSRNLTGPSKKQTYLTARPKGQTAEIQQAEIDAAGHAQFTRDRVVEIANELARDLRKTQCVMRELAHQTAISTAQHNGWLAASYLDLPICSKLIPIGEDVGIVQCAPKNVSFTTVVTSCGPQPRYQNSTINIEGWELTRFSECYWYSNFVNFNGRAHAFKNGTWSPVMTSIVFQGQKLVNTVPMEVDNALGTLLKLHPAIKSNPMSPAAAVADILAAVQEQNSIDFTSNGHMSGVLVYHLDAPHVSFMARIGHWLSNFGIISGVGISIALAFRFCALGTLIARFVPGCAWLQFVNPFSWLAENPRRPNEDTRRSDAERGEQPVTQTQPVAAMPNITVNLPNIERETPPVPNRTNVRRNLTAAESIRAHREAAKLLQ